MTEETSRPVPFSFKSPYRADFTVDVVDALTVLRNFFPNTRPGKLHTYTMGEFQRSLDIAIAALQEQAQDGSSSP